MRRPLATAALVLMAAGPPDRSTPLAIAGRTPQETARPAAGSTCDPTRIRPESYRLTVEAQALNVTRPRYRWWDAYDIGKPASAAGDLNEAAIAIAERARQLDAGNLLAHAQLARHYVVAGREAQHAREAWTRTLDGGGAIVWVASLLDVDAPSFFVVAFDRAGVRIYRLGQLAGALRTVHGVPQLPGPDREELWRALGGCLPDAITPEAAIAWRDVRAIESTPVVLGLELDGRVAIASDRRRRHTDDRVVVSLHPVPGEFDHRYALFPPRVHVRADTHGPAAFQERVRGLLVEFFDPEGRIRLPKSRRW